MLNEANRPPNLAPPDANRDEALDAVKKAAGLEGNTDEPDVAPNIDKDGRIRKDSEVLRYINDDGEIVEIRHDYGGHEFEDDPTQNRGPHFNYPNTSGGDHFDYTGSGTPFGPGTYYRP